MKNLALLILLLTSSQAHPESYKAKPFFESCVAACKTMKAAFSSGSKQLVEISSAVNPEDACAFQVHRIETEIGWDKITHPHYQGCQAAVEGVFQWVVKEKDEDYIESKICSDNALKSEAQASAPEKHWYDVFYKAKN